MPNTNTHNKDYYQTLGLSKGATDDQIKQAYRKLAREFHPDMVTGDKAAAEKRFKEINEAYQILSDPQKRKMYDAYGSAGPGFGGFGGRYGGQSQGGGAGQGFGGFNGFDFSGFSGFGQGRQQAGGGSQANFEDIDPFEIFESFFGRGFGGASGSGAGGAGNSRLRRGKNLFYELNISFAEAVKGAEKTIKIESGQATIKIPAGIRDGMEVKYEGKGLPGPNNAPSGDLYITVRIAYPNVFKVVGDLLVVELEIDFAQAALGDVIEVSVVDTNSSTGLGTAKLKIPAGTQYGTQFRLKEKGLPHLQGRGASDVIAQIFVTVPRKLNKKQKELLEEYRRTIPS